MLVFPHAPPGVRPGGINWNNPGNMVVPPLAPVVETSNIVSHPTGPEYTFSVGEGSYFVKEDILLATPPPHPSEIPNTNPNPLATATSAPTAGVKITPVVIKDSAASHFHGLTARRSGANSLTDADSRVSGDTEADGGSEGSGKILNGANVRRKKPKNNIGKGNSSLVSRLITHDNMSKRLHDRSPEGMLMFANINRSFVWLDMSWQSKHEPLSKVLFTKAHPLCHDVNHLTKAPNFLDVVVGFSSADIIWFDPTSNKYARLNKNGVVSSKAVYDIKWVPGSENLFLAAHGDGNLILYDKEKDDPTKEEMASENPKKGGVKKTNPVARWQLSKQPLKAFSFSPSGQHIAIVGEDGCLRILKYARENYELLDVFNSYYGELICVCWSPDGKYILTGGQDDLVSIWSFAERRIIARCQGHHSWVTGVAFDPWRCDGKTYRFGSVGEDCRLLLWDFSVGLLHRPKATSHTSRGSISSPAPNSSGNPVTRARTLDSRHRSDSNAVSMMAGDDGNTGVVHPVESRVRTALLPPIMSKTVDEHPLSQIIFREDSIMITCSEGHVTTWARPMPNASQTTLLG